MSALSRRLVLPLAVLALTAAAAAAVLVPLVQDVSDAEHRLRAEEAALHAAAGRAAAEAAARTVLAADTERLTRLAGAGFWGHDARFHLREALRAAEVRAKPLHLEYQIGARREAAVATGPLQVAVHETPVSVRARLTHEGDLLDFLATVHERHGGLLRVDACRMRRAPGGVQPERDAGVEADCRFAWFSATAHEPGERP